MRVDGRRVRSHALNDLFPISLMVKLELIFPSQISIELFFRYKFQKIRIKPDLYALVSHPWRDSDNLN